MPKPKLKITIGISAYNEESNIHYLISALLSQKVTLGTVSQILIISDGSTDKTVEQSKQTADPKIQVLEHSERMGKVITQNELLKKAKGDVLILLDADVLPQNDQFLEELVQPFVLDSKVGLVSANTISVPPRTFFEMVIADSHEFKKCMYERINAGDNIYTCHGRALGMSRAFYQHLKWPEGYPEDAYAYLTCIQKKFKYIYVAQTAIAFRSPATFEDHLYQSQRFLGGKKKLEQRFSPESVKKEYAIPLRLIVVCLAKYLLLKPVTTLTYLVIIFYIQCMSAGTSQYEQKWRIARSSKRIIV